MSPHRHRRRHGAASTADGTAVAFSLWAPRQAKVGLHLLTPDDRRVDMARDDQGWHTATVPGLRPGATYLFRLPDGAELPDPASRLQADTVHGPSVVVDADFAWRDRDFAGITLDDLVLYELHVGTFTTAGTFDAVIPHLQGLRDLGVTAIELLPVAQFPGRRNWGYDGVLPFAVQNSYGGPAGLRRLVDACHTVGLGVVVDVVYNHMGPEGNYLARFGPYFTDAYRTPWGSAMNFDDAGSDEVRRFFVESALTLVGDSHVDGLRVDAVHAIRDGSAQPFLQELTHAVQCHGAGRRRTPLVIAESDLNDARILHDRQWGGLGMDAQWSDDFHHALHAHATGERQGYYADFGRLDQVAQAFRKGWLYAGHYSRYRGRRHGNSPRHLDARRFVVFTQNHDQIGNRALGDRLAAGDLARQRALAVPLLLSPFTPLLFMGQEHGETAPFLYFVDHGDADLIEAVRQGRQREFDGFGWDPAQLADPAAESTFTRCILDHGLCGRPAHRGLRELYRELLRLRAAHPALRGGTDHLDATPRDGLVLVRRWSGDDELAFAVAFVGGGELTGHAGWRILLDTEDPTWRGEADAPRRDVTVGSSLRLPPHSAVVLARRPTPA